jgi:hypothetical protein
MIGAPLYDVPYCAQKSRGVHKKRGGLRSCEGSVQKMLTGAFAPAFLKHIAVLRVEADILNETKSIPYDRFAALVVGAFRRGHPLD